MHFVRQVHLQVLEVVETTPGVIKGRVVVGMVHRHAPHTIKNVVERVHTAVATTVLIRIQISIIRMINDRVNTAKNKLMQTRRVLHQHSSCRDTKAFHHINNRNDRVINKSK